MRLGEVLPLRREDFDGETLEVRRPAHEGVVLEGTKTDHGEENAGRVVPVPRPSPECSKPRFRSTAKTESCCSRRHEAACGSSAPSTATSGSPTQEAADLDIRPHECRHNYVTHQRAAGVDDADLAEIVGHRIETMLARYALGGGEFSASS